jgi:hypothetical protein
VAGACSLALLAAALGCARAPSSERARGFDPDSLPDAFTPPSAALMWPGATRAFEVTPEGNLDNGAWVVRIAPSAAGVSARSPQVIGYESRWLPVARWNRVSGDVVWAFEAVTFPGPGHRETGLVVSLEVVATNRGPAARAATLGVALQPLGSDPVFVAYDAPETPSPPLAWAAKGDTAYAWAERAAAGPEWQASWTLAPAESRRARFLFPAYPERASDLEHAARTSHAERTEAMRAYWTSVLAQGTRFELQDPEVERALDAARVLLLTCRERHGNRWFAIGGPFQYRDVWLRDGARAAAALAVTGHTAEARALAEGVLEFQWPQGAFLSQRGQPDGTGQALWTFEQALLRPAPADSLQRFADAARRAWQWLEWQRAQAPGLHQPGGPMLPFADPHDGELVKAQLVGTDAWAIAGYRAAARLLRAARHETQATEVDRSLEQYLEAFSANLARTGSRDVPPSWEDGGRDWGNLAVGWPCAALPPRDPRLAALASRVWSAASGTGLVTYGPADSLHGYVGADLGTWALRAGRRDDAERVLAALLHWRDACGAGGEIFSRQGGYGRNLPPHPTAAAALIALTRNCLLYDDSDTLALTMGARATWWRGAHVRQAPTRWGAIDLEFARSGSRAHWRWSAVPVWTSLTLPPGTVLADAVPSPLRGAAGASVVLAPPNSTHAEVSLAGARVP